MVRDLPEKRERAGSAKVRLVAFGALVLVAACSAMTDLAPPPSADAAAADGTAPPPPPSPTDGSPVDGTLGADSVADNIGDADAGRPVTPPMSCLLTGINDTISALAVDSTEVYFTTTGRFANGDGTLQKLTFTGGGGSPVVLEQYQAFPQAVAVDSSHVYWSTQD